jgi:TPR repeat protein
MVANGRGETKDMSKAFYWVEQAAYNDYPLAVVASSVMYSKGIGIDKDNSKATVWKNKADSLGITDFNEKKAKVSELLNLK